MVNEVSNLAKLKGPQAYCFSIGSKVNKLYIYIMDGNVEVSPSGGFSQIYNSMNSTIANANPLVLIALTVIVLFYFILFSYLDIIQ